MSPGRRSPGHRSAELPEVPALANKKKKPKKKRAPGVTPGVAGCPDPVGDPEQVATEPPARVGPQRSREDMMCINFGCAGHFRSECEAPLRCPTTLAYLGVRRLTFELESPAAVDLHSPAPGASAPGDDGREGDGGSSEESSFCEEDDGNGGVPPVASDGPHTPGSTSSSPSSSAGVASRVASGIEPVIIVGPSRVVTNLVVLAGGGPGRLFPCRYHGG
ncbi:hypothetical protein ZWY2020_042122 [Hordeum vulgare]|nr:hypothetical protein ZWY2020_042122 [Hordeum vulgare]